LPSGSSDIVSAATCLASHYQATHVPSRDHCKASVLHLTMQNPGGCSFRMAHTCTAISFPKAVLSFSFPCSVFRSVYSPTAPDTPSVKPLVRSGSLIGCQSVSVCAAECFESGPYSYIYGSYFAVFSFISEDADHSTMPRHSFSAIKWKSRLFALRSPALRSSWKSCRVLSCFPDVAPVLSLVSLFHWYLPVSPDISSRTSVL
jgi:hypothetical protein